ncbi:hypothetical protein NDU88_002413 [Pleurodeles waltl]|uniref:Uncharacterized protein n=1 Tax=Pleurodeles waltl TaxID=8319 RepID=A0AAV7MXB3_PLEWA|nr:hypothetical protein NDU88_002413 [Pleurodeles waltl]
MVKGLLGVLTAARGKRWEKSEGDDGWTEQRYWGRLETVELIVFYPSKIKLKEGKKRFGKKSVCGSWALEVEWKVRPGWIMREQANRSEDVAN